ncbi:prephenate dehydrogenase/arogenate dehydrogenase family protein [Candidatus Persebacteraceae bacterium Df01]|jgi:prephenate dehydrogenase|uniref:Prephenate dehydrogenase/arogenate dehydrogenase family protein n=1 Tax=Candidatus Doriopsillibacter californiensis TaxID=2970740 RepID=A0ABT7QKA9_9GAMM|nr:prephenate dehydrogenase/arogenate dehydrogenase family protein [Candidatus Persebacteraceae bacterium Df01]
MRSVGVIGLGLIGGSFARAATAAGATVVGADSCAQTRRAALEAGVVRAAYDSPSAVCGADDIFIAVPVGSVESIFADIADALSPTSVIFDGGSCKRSVISKAAEQLGDNRRRFVPSHPIAGNENSGFSASNVDLFKNCWAVLCTDGVDEEAVQVVSLAWQQVGANTVNMSAAEHDDIFAVVSHLPHLLSYALVESIRTRPDSARYLHYAASGFRDFTRVASSHPIMWRDICLANADNLLASLVRFREELDTLEGAIKDGNSVLLYERFASARQLRRDWAATLED